MMSKKLTFIEVKKTLVPCSILVYINKFYKEQRQKLGWGEIYKSIRIKHLRFFKNQDEEDLLKQDKNLQLIAVIEGCYYQKFKAFMQQSIERYYTKFIHQFKVFIDCHIFCTTNVQFRKYIYWIYNINYARATSPFTSSTSYKYSIQSP